MPWNDDRSIQSLRLTYNAAVTAHRSCARAVNEATLRGDVPAAALVEAERKARARLEEARAKLHQAMSKAISGGDAGPPA
jgi:hypothetical protein